MRSGKLAALGAVALVCASVLAPAAQAQDFFSQLFGGFAPPAQQPYIPMPFADDDGQVDAPRSRGTRPRYGGGQALLRAHLRRALFPGHRHPTMRAGRQSCNSFCPASETKVFYGSNIDNATPKTAKPIRSCRTRSAIATKSSAAAPATARTRSGSRRSRSRTIRRCARATSSPAKTAFWSPAAAPTSAAPN